MAVSTPAAPVMVLLIITLGRFCPEQEYGTASYTGADYNVPLVRDSLQFLFVHLVCSYPLLSSVNAIMLMQQTLSSLCSARCGSVHGSLQFTLSS